MSWATFSQDYLICDANGGGWNYRERVFLVLGAWRNTIGCGRW
jgi:hypothetical protein